MLTAKEEKRRIIRQFKTLYKEAPHYKVLKQEHPVLFKAIMKHWNGYRAFLRAIKMVDYYFFLRNQPINRRLECDGVFHRIGNTAERDKTIDEYLRSYGIKTLRITIKDDPNKYAERILAFLLEGILELGEKENA